MNLVNILKYAPKGLKLWSDVYGEVGFDGIDMEDVYPIKLSCCDFVPATVTETGAHAYICDSVPVDKKEISLPCTLWPSKYSRSWENWQSVLFKDGDIVVLPERYIAIFKEFDGLSVTADVVCYGGLASDGKIQITDETEPWGFSTRLRYASPEERNHLIRALREEGYKWDGEKKELRKMSFGLKELEHTISCGACDSELIRTEWAVPEGYTARVEFGKIIIEKKK